MKLTPAVVKLFAHDQRHYSLETAIFNLLWLQASELLMDLGLIHVSTRSRRAQAVLRKGHRMARKPAPYLPHKPSKAGALPHRPSKKGALPHRPVKH